MALQRLRTQSCRLIIRNDDRMDLESADVPDLIGALADRFSEYDIDPRAALLIAAEMLAAAMAESDDVELDLETVH